MASPKYRNLLTPVLAASAALASPAQAASAPVLDGNGSYTGYDVHTPTVAETKRAATATVQVAAYLGNQPGSMALKDAVTDQRLNTISPAGADQKFETRLFAPGQEEGAALSAAAGCRQQGALPGRSLVWTERANPIHKALVMKCGG